MTAAKKKPAKTPIDLVSNELSPLGQGRLMRGRAGRPETNDPQFIETVHAYIALNMLTKIIEKRLAAIKPLLHKVAEDEGNQVSEVGSTEVVIAGNRVCREKRTATAPDEQKLRALLQTRGVKLDDAFDEVKTLVLNPSKLKFLIDKGTLDQKDVDALHAVSWAIKCEASNELQAAFDVAMLGGDDEPEDREPAQSEKVARRKRAAK